MEIKSRVPGKIVRFEKQIGDSVEVKDVLIVMEAMKMKQKCELFPPNSSHRGGRAKPLDRRGASTLQWSAESPRAERRGRTLKRRRVSRAWF